MNRQEKLQQIEEFGGLMGSANLMVVMENRGLNAEQNTKLRKKVYASGATLRVFKNTFVKKGLGEKIAPEMKADLEGPNAFLFAGGEFVGQLKAVMDFAKGQEEKLIIKCGTLDGVYVSKEKLKILSELPGKDQLRAQLLGTMMGPVRGLVTALAGNVRNLLNVLNNVKEVKEKNN